MTEERTRLQKIVMIVIVAMIALFGVLNVVPFFNKGVVFHDSLLKKTTTSESVSYSGKAYGESIEITVTPSTDGKQTEVTFQIGNRYRDICTLERGLPSIKTEHGKTVEGIRISKNGRVMFDGGYDFDGSEYRTWYNKDGTMDMSRYIGFGYVGSDYWGSYETTSNSVMRFAQGPELVHRGHIGLYFMMVLLSLLLLLDVTHPTALFYMQHACDVRDPEPSDFYIAMQKVGWVIYPFFLLAGYIVTLRMLP